MVILNTALVLFIILESFNILLLYTRPESRIGNGMGAFKAFTPVALDDPSAPGDMKRMVRYLVNWVAGTKLIFITLLIVIAIFGDDRLKALSLVVLIPSVAIFYWRLYPLIRDMDSRGEIEPKGYSRTLAVMIAGFIAVFASAAVVYFLNQV